MSESNTQVPQVILRDLRAKEGQTTTTPNEYSASLKWCYLRAEAKFHVYDDFALLTSLDSHVKDHGTDCAICKEPISPPRNLLSRSLNPVDRWLTHEPVETRCGHVFGATCLWAWLYDGQSNSCPCCRDPLIPTILEYVKRDHFAHLGRLIDFAYLKPKT